LILRRSRLNEARYFRPSAARGDGPSQRVEGSASPSDTVSFYGRADTDGKNAAIPIDDLFERVRSAQPMNRSILALAAALAASPAFAAQDYPRGLFENSPVVPSGPPDATAPSGPPDDSVPFGPRNADGPMDDYCAGVASRTFRSLAEVRQARDRCDHNPNAVPLSPPAEDQPD
jgi:hypothetical protein